MCKLFTFFARGTRIFGLFVVFPIHIENWGVVRFVGISTAEVVLCSRNEDENLQTIGSQLGLKVSKGQQLILVNLIFIIVFKFQRFGPGEVLHQG